MKHSTTLNPEVSSEDGFPKEKEDRRIRRTQRLLGEALLSLILEKGYDAITIRDITERADVAYVTFFRNFKHKDDLLLHRLEEELNLLRNRIEGAAREAQQLEAEKQEGLLIFEHVRERAVLYKALLSSQGALQARKRIQDLITTIFLKTCKPLQGSRIIPAEISANHIAASLVALVQWWLEHDLAYSSAVMAEIYNQLIITATINTARGSRTPVKHNK
jgi:AcrR family transcriptional regulator